jgi:hypothetical protein
VDVATASEAVLSRARVSGSAVLYRLADVGYEIHLERALVLLAPSGPGRGRPTRGEARAIQIPNPPITVPLGEEHVTSRGREIVGELSARIFDFGVISLRLRVAAPAHGTWRSYIAFGNDLDVLAEASPVFERALVRLVERIAPAIERPAISSVTEDYVVFRISDARLETGDPLRADALRDEDVIPLLLNEHKPLSAAARRELLPHRFSYYDDDLTLLTWDNALVVEPSVPEDEETDVQYVLEFANAQLLELRVYDAILNAQLPAMYDRIAAVRGRRLALLNRHYATLLTELQVLVADSTELVERVENALKVTDDVYLARVYAAALEIFRGRTWRSGIDRKLAIIRQAYSMLNAESQATRSEALEFAVVILIVAELVLAFVTWRSIG